MSLSANAFEGIQKAGTVLIADTADFDQIARFKPSEGTTNPSLLYLAAAQPAYAPLLNRTISYARAISPSNPHRLALAAEHLAVEFGTKIYNLTGRVSTEVDITVSFSTADTIAAALRILDLYAAKGVPKEAVRIKISATWEGIQAGRVLQKEHGASVLITIVFGMVQAVTAAEADVDCIAPYVGRIDDWHKLKGETNKGVQTVQQMQRYFWKHGLATKIMGASFRSTAQARELAGLDMLTIAPAILAELEKEILDVVPVLTRESAQAADLPQESYINDESAFRWAFNADACAVEKSADAMRRFAEDTEKLKGLLADLLK